MNNFDRTDNPHHGSLTMSEVFPRLFYSTKLAGNTLKSRMAMAPPTRQMAEPDGPPTDEMAARYARRARGGCGLIIAEPTKRIDWDAAPISRSQASPPDYGLAYPMAINDPN
jgi:2,4-dienoyl-CoA reductase-like NADH-dependent reductase (Old Yellow Enzyme family)